jgi:uncharacterized protein YbgA (DUF1722 family)
MRFDQPYLMPQTYFQPYPMELMDVEAVKASDIKFFWK